MGLDREWLGVLPVHDRASLRQLQRRGPPKRPASSAPPRSSTPTALAPRPPERPPLRRRATSGDKVPAPKATAAAARRGRRPARRPELAAERRPESAGTRVDRGDAGLGDRPAAAVRSERRSHELEVRTGSRPAVVWIGDLVGRPPGRSRSRRRTAATSPSLREPEADRWSSGSAGVTPGLIAKSATRSRSAKSVRTCVVAAVCCRAGSWPAACPSSSPGNRARPGRSGRVLVRGRLDGDRPGRHGAVAPAVAAVGQNVGLGAEPPARPQPMATPARSTTRTRALDDGAVMAGYSWRSRSRDPNPGRGILRRTARDGPAQDASRRIDGREVLLARRLADRCPAQAPAARMPAAASSKALHARVPRPSIERPSGRTRRARRSPGETAGKAERGRADASARSSPRTRPGPIRFRPLPEVVAGAGRRAGQRARSTKAGRRARPRPGRSRSKTAKALFALAGRAASKPVAPARAGRRVPARRPRPRPEPRRGPPPARLPPLQGGLGHALTPPTCETGHVLHPKFGWVQADWVAAPRRGRAARATSRASGKVRTGSPPTRPTPCSATGPEAWKIDTDRISDRDQRPAGRGDRLRPPARSVPRAVPLAVRRRDRRGEPAAGPAVRQQGAEAGGRRRRSSPSAYFATQGEYVELPPRASSASTKRSAWATTCPCKQARRASTGLAATSSATTTTRSTSHATLYHEASHQILFEIGRQGRAYDKNRANYWVLEGLGTYFETVDRRRTARSSSAAWSARGSSRPARTARATASTSRSAKFVGDGRGRVRRREGRRGLPQLRPGDGPGRLPDPRRGRQVPRGVPRLRRRTPTGARSKRVRRWPTGWACRSRRSTRSSGRISKYRAVQRAGHAPVMGVHGRAHRRHARPSPAVAHSPT